MPEATSYGIAILVLNGLGASSLAAFFYRRWVANLGIPYSRLYLVAMLLVVLWGGLIFGLAPLGGSPASWLISIPLGIMGGVAAAKADRAIRRLTYWRGSAPKRFEPSRTRVPQNPKRVGSITGRKHTTSASNDREFHHGSEGYGFSLWSLVALAALEEVFYRGWLLEVCRLLPSTTLGWAAIVATVLVFSLIHLPFGWPDVIGKVPLGILALIGVQLTGSVAAAIVTHIYFNVQFWWEQRISRPDVPVANTRGRGLSTTK